MGQERHKREALTVLSDADIIAAAFERGLCRQIERRVFVDGIVLRQLAPDANVEQWIAAARAKAMHDLAGHMLAEGVVDFTAHPAGDAFAPGSVVYTATVGVLL